MLHDTTINIVVHDMCCKRYDLNEWAILSWCLKIICYISRVQWKWRLSVRMTMLLWRFLKQFFKINDSDLVSKPNTKAFIWKYFGFEANEKGNPRSKNHPKFRLCRLEIAAKDGNTSNLYSHLKNNHPEEYDIVQKAAANTSRKRQSDKTQQPALQQSSLHCRK